MFKALYLSLGTALCLMACSQDVIVESDAKLSQASVQETTPEANVSEQKPFAIPRTYVVPIHDTKSDRPYELYIKLPRDYKKNQDQTYPVIFITDGKWQMDILSGSAEHLMPDAILVGISWQKDFVHKWGEHVSRFRDFTFLKDEDAPVETGEAGNHLSFIRDDVFKFIENNYRTDPTERTFFGYSTGGGFGAYILFEQPDTFKHYILGSPAFGPKHSNVLDALEGKLDLSQQNLNTHVYVSIGELEENEMKHTEKFVSMLELKRQSGLSFDGLEVIEGADHGTASPVAVIKSMIWLSQRTSE